MVHVKKRRVRTLLLVLICLFPGAHASTESAAESAAFIHNLAASLRYPTISNRDPEKIDGAVFTDFLEFLRNTYPNTFSQLSSTTISDYSLVLHWQGEQAGESPVLIDAHYDVVPIEPGTEADWSYPPFAGTVADGYIWGRGVVDDKAAVMAHLESIENLLEVGYRPQRDLYFSIVHDEEVSGVNGAQKVVEYFQQQDIRFDYMIGEGGGFFQDTPFLKDKAMGMIALAEKAYVTLKLTASGSGGHSSMPVEDNSVVTLAAAVQAIHDNPFPAKIVSPVNHMLEAIGQETSGLQGFVMRHHRLTGAFITNKLRENPISAAMVRSTSAVTMFDAGIKENVIPQQASAKVNFRLLPGHTVEQLLQQISELVDNPAVTIEAETWGDSPPVADIGHPAYTLIKNSMSEVFPEAAIIPSMLTATTDTRFYQLIAKNIYRVRGYSLPLSDAAGVHGTNERLSVKAAADMVRMHQHLIRRLGE